MCEDDRREAYEPKQIDSRVSHQLESYILDMNYLRRLVTCMP
jgi:hypothetical protein